MSSRYLVCYREKNAHIVLADRFRERPIGQLVFSFLDVDWNAFAEAVSAARRSAFTMAQVQSAFAALRGQVAAPHPFFSVALNHLAIKPDPLYAAYQWAGDMAHFAAQFAPLVEQVLVCAPGETALPLERYASILSQNAALARFAAKQREGITLHFPTLPAEDGTLTAAACFGSCSLPAVVFLEFEHMVSGNYAVRRCANCGKYFLPFSVAARYCDRIFADGKSCREIATREKYLERLHENRAKTLYVKNNNAYQMRTRRAPESSPVEEYRAWRSRVKDALSAYERGEMDFETFSEIAALPQRVTTRQKNKITSE